MRYVLFTAFNLVAGAASISGLLLTQSFSGSDPKVVIPFVLALFLAAYVLLVPHTWLVKNAKAKVSARYRDPSGDGDLLFQKGEVKIRSNGKNVDVRFDPPFAATPEVYILNDHHVSGFTPTVHSATAVCATFDPHLNTTPADSGIFTWIAVGRPLEAALGTKMLSQVTRPPGPAA